MTMHAARLDRSPRLQRVLAVLQDGREYTTRDIVVRARVCAVNSCAAELRANGYDIRCRQLADEGGRVWIYRLVQPPAGPGGAEATAGSSGYPLPGRSQSASGSALAVADGPTGDDS